MSLIGKKAPMVASIVALTMAASVPAYAKSFTDTLSQEEVAARMGIDVDALRKIIGASFAPATAPGMSMGSPLGFGAAWGSAYLFIGGQNRGVGTDTRNAAKLSGAYGAGFGLGRADILALQTDYAVLDASNGPGEASNMSFKLHHRFDAQDAALAMG